MDHEVKQPRPRRMAFLLPELRDSKDFPYRSGTFEVVQSQEKGMWICTDDNMSYHASTLVILPDPTETQWSCLNHLNQLAEKIKAWRESKGFQTSWNNVPEKLMLIVTELGETMEAYRRFNESDLCGYLFYGYDPPGKETEAAHFREEIADTLIRLLDLSASLGLNIEEEVAKKMARNVQRPLLHGKQR